MLTFQVVNIRVPMEANTETVLQDYEARQQMRIAVEDTIGKRYG
jgi:hypothetical protein